MKNTNLEKKANLVRTKLLIKTSIELKKSNNKNTMKINSRSVFEINKSYESQMIIINNPVEVGKPTNFGMKELNTCSNSSSPIKCPKRRRSSIDDYGQNIEIIENIEDIDYIDSYVSDLQKKKKVISQRKYKNIIPLIDDDDSSHGVHVKIVTSFNTPSDNNSFYFEEKEKFSFNPHKKYKSKAIEGSHQLAAIVRKLKKIPKKEKKPKKILSCKQRKTKPIIYNAPFKAATYRGMSSKTSHFETPSTASESKDFKHVFIDVQFDSSEDEEEPMKKNNSSAAIININQKSQRKSLYNDQKISSILKKKNNDDLVVDSASIEMKRKSFFHTKKAKTTRGINMLAKPKTQEKNIIPLVDGKGKPVKY